MVHVRSEESLFFLPLWENFPVVNLLNFSQSSKKRNYSVFHWGKFSCFSSFELFSAPKQKSYAIHSLFHCEKIFLLLFFLNFSQPPNRKAFSNCWKFSCCSIFAFTVSKLSPLLLFSIFSQLPNKNIRCDLQNRALNLSYFADTSKERKKNLQIRAPNCIIP